MYSYFMIFIIYLMDNLIEKQGYYAATKEQMHGMESIWTELNREINYVL